MAVHKIVEIPDPRLRTISTPVAAVDDDVRTLIDDMFDTMYASRGIGLAAIQIGVAKRILVIDLQEEGEDGKPVREPRVFINPEIVATDADTNIYNEGCLSVPDQYAEVERPATCRVRWLDRDGTAHDEQLDGLLATCIQHEMDHLEGIIFIDHLSRLKREMVLKKLAKQRKAA
jgi:peptide deformylase